MPKEPYRLFISYAREDEDYRARLVTHISQPVRERKLVVWSDRMIRPGSEWDKEIRKEIRTCDAVVFLVSADLLASGYVYGVEMEIARERLARGEIDVLPVPIYTCLVDQTWLAALQALWDPEKPIGALADRGEQEAAWTQVARKLCEAAHNAAEARERLALREPPAAAPPGPEIVSPAAVRFRRGAGAPLLSKGGFFGRETELADLDKWLRGEPPYEDVRLIILRALGGMGKSALAWRWSQVNASNIGSGAGFEGVFWWSFYSKGFDVRAFARAALAFMGIDKDHLPTGLGPQLELLVKLTETRAAIFVLDGFERELRRYARRDAPDDTEEAGKLSGAARPDDCVDQETDAFLRRITATHGPSRWLISTRVTPATLVEAYGAREFPLGGLSHAATRAVFEDQGVTGSEDAFADIARRFGGHGLTLSIFARTLKRNDVHDLDQAAHRAGGLHAFWRAMEGQAPIASDLRNEAERRLRVLIEAIEALSAEARDVLQSFTFEENPPSLAMLERLNNHLPTEAIPLALMELRAHGLLAPSDNAFLYDLHPVVRFAADRNISGDGIYRAIDVFQTLDRNQSYKSLEEAQPAIELFLALARAERFDAAYHVYRSRLFGLFRAQGSNGRQAELLSRLCEEEFAPRLSSVEDQIELLSDLAIVLHNQLRFGDAWRAASHLEMLGKQTSNPAHQTMGRIGFALSATHIGQLAVVARCLSGPLDQWRLEIEIARLQALRGEVGQAEFALRVVRKEVERLDNNARCSLLNDMCNIAWSMRDSEVLSEVVKALVAATKDAGRPTDKAIAELHSLRASFLRTDVSIDGKRAEIAAAARDIQARFAAMDLAGWCDSAALIASVAGAQAGGEPAARSAADLREIAERFERNGGVIHSIDAWLDAAEAWALAGNISAARAAATHARELAYCDGPPHTAKLYEDRADVLLARLKHS